MYSVVLMMALTSGGDTPDLGHRGGCHGCQGGCFGSSYAGCYGGGGGCRGGRAHHGGRRGGCGGSSYNCCGGTPVYSCQGGSYSGGCYGSYSGGCYGGQGGCTGGHGGMMMPGAGKPAEKLTTPPTQKKSEATPASATIVVSLPADAKLTIDNEPTTSTGTSRVFTSPILNAGREYHYTLKAQIVRDGKPVTVERVVTVKAGEITPVPLTLPVASVAQR